MSQDYWNDIDEYGPEQLAPSAATNPLPGMTYIYFRDAPNWTQPVMPFNYIDNGLTSQGNLCIAPGCEAESRVYPAARFMRTHEFNLVCTSCGQRYFDRTLFTRFPLLL